MKRLLSHTRRKMEITQYLNAKLIQISQQRNKILVVPWVSECKTTQRDVSHLQSSQEEADTKMILHALDAASNGATEINVGYRRVRPLVKTILRALYRSPLCHGNRSAPSSDQVAAHLHRPLAGLGLRHSRYQWCGRHWQLC